MGLKRQAALLLCCIVMSGCMPLESNVENLMRPPTLTVLQTEVDGALRDKVGDSFTLKYPESGDYRSGYNFIDIDGDGSNEAVAFVSYNGAIQLALLRQNAGNWYVSDLVPGEVFCTEVDFVAVHTLGNMPVLMVGWGGTGRENKLMTLYSYTGIGGTQAALKVDSRWDYSRMTVLDIDGDGWDELMLLVSADGYDYDQPFAQLVGESSDGIIDILSETQLARNIISFYQPVVGMLGNGEYGIAADCMLGNGRLCTITIAYGEDGLTLPLDAAPQTTDSVDETQTSATTSLFRNTVRRQQILSCDLNSDGVVDIPIERAAEGYGEDDADCLFFVEYSNLRGSDFEVVSTAYVNTTHGYRLLLPSGWQEHPVSALLQADGREVVFFINSTGSIYDHSKELLRIQVSSTLDGTDKLSQDRYFQLATKGSYLYSAALPLSPIEGLRLTAADVRAAFSLLN